MYPGSGHSHKQGLDKRPSSDQRQVQVHTSDRNRDCDTGVGSVLENREGQTEVHSTVSLLSCTGGRSRRRRCSTSVGFRSSSGRGTNTGPPIPVSPGVPSVHPLDRTSSVWVPTARGLGPRVQVPRRCLAGKSVGHTVVTRSPQDPEPGGDKNSTTHWSPFRETRDPESKELSRPQPLSDLRVQIPGKGRLVGWDGGRSDRPKEDVSLRMVLLYMGGCRPRVGRDCRVLTESPYLAPLLPSLLRVRLHCPCTARVTGVR